MGNQDILDSKLPTGAVLAGGFVLLVAVAGATYQVTKSAMSDQIGALSVELDGLRMQLDGESRSADSRNLDDTETLPAVMVEQPVEVQELVDQIATLEEEKRELQSQLATASTSALAPESELRELLENLEEDDQQVRISAAIGLHSLGDPRSVPALLEYFHRDPDEATRHMSSIRWMQKIFSLDRDAGIEFTVQLMESDDRNTAEWAYGELMGHIYQEYFDEIRPAIEALALTSQKTLVRTRAKLILKYSQEWLDEKSGVED